MMMMMMMMTIIIMIIIIIIVISVRTENSEFQYSGNGEACFPVCKKKTDG